MSLFKQAILKNNKQDENLIAKRWAKFLEFKSKIEFIKSVKEEKYQTQFLKDIFEECLGFTLDSTNPNSYNLEREKKNETDGKKADGVIYVNNQVVGIIELKDQKSKNLDLIEIQAFNYHNSHSNSKYIIISNFDELRFYIDKKTNYEKFSLFNLTYDEFKKLHLILSFESIKEDLPLRLKEKSANFETEITKELYKKFSNLRLQLFENIINKNEIDKNIALSLSQKILDRFIFIFFAEDRGLIDSQTTTNLVNTFKNDWNKNPLFSFIKILFNAINFGSDRPEMFPYNGGMFAEDNTLNNLTIDDNVLLDILKLSEYDFESDIDVNILGHIFENSLDDLEKLKENNFKLTQRKKDGIFYTPSYITDYIVKNTLDKICEDKKLELNILNIDSENITTSDIQNLKSYKDFLENLRVIDPACGSGAFLNQAFNHLFIEYNFVHDMTNRYNTQKKIQDLFEYSNFDLIILEKNLFGVDINSEAIEITKLSLWLKTAMKNRKLTNLSNNIIQANSLIDMPFEFNSFDVVIGNPPYIKEYTHKNAFDGLRGSPYYQGKMDLWYFFGCQALDLIKENGLVSFIAPNNWISNTGASKFRNKVLNDGKILEFIDFGDFKVFEEASIQTMIYIMQKTNKNKNYQTKVSRIKNKKISSDDVISFLNKNINIDFEYFISTINQNKLLDSIINFSNETIEIVLEKIKNKQNFVLEDKEVAQGIVGAPDKAFIVKEYEIMKFELNELKYIKKFHTNAGKYWTETTNKFIIYLSDKNFHTENIQEYQNLEKHFEIFKDELIEAKNKYKTPNKRYYYLHRERDESFFKEGAKIICSTRTLYPSNTYTEEEFYGSRALNYIKTDRINLKFLVCILNSNIANFWLKYKGKKTGDLLQIDKSQLISVPIINIDEEKQKPFIKLVDEILESKQKIKDYKILLDEAMKNDNFDREIKLKKELETLENICISNEKEIDNMVYKFYDLSEDEIRIVEGE